MTSKQMRERLEQAWAGIDEMAEASKDSHSAVFALQNLYRDFSPQERRAADQVIMEWILSDDDDKKVFDGLALIDEFRISSAVPALRQLADRFSLSDSVSAPYSWAKVNRIIGRLTASSESD